MQLHRFKGSDEPTALSLGPMATVVAGRGTSRCHPGFGGAPEALTHLLFLPGWGAAWHQAGCVCVILTRMQTCWTGLAGCRRQPQAHLLCPFGVCGRQWITQCLGSQRHSAVRRCVRVCLQVLCQESGRSPVIRGQVGLSSVHPQPSGVSRGGPFCCLGGGWRGQHRTGGGGGQPRPAPLRAPWQC